MNILFENAGLAWLAGLISVPLLLHLFARSRPPRFLFSATDFVARVVRHNLRVKRPKDWLLLICRTLLLAALMLLFMRPILYRHGPPPAKNAARHLVVIVDRTASMGWTEGGRSRFAAACAEAAQLLDGLSARDTANLVWLDAEPDAVFPEMGPNTGYLVKRLAEARVSSESGDPAAAVSLALSLLKPAEGLREVCIVSDFQASQWKDVPLTFPTDIRVTTLSTAQGSAPNGAVVALRTDPLQPLVGDPAQIVCEVANYSGQPRARTVTFEIDEARLSRQVMVPAWGKAAAVVEHVFRKQGRSLVQARLDEDAFGADDWRGGAVPVRRALRVGVVTGDPALAGLWTRALHAIPWTEAAAVTLDKVQDAESCDLLMIAGWNGAQLDSLARLHTAGLPMIVAPVAGLEVRALAVLADLPPVDGSVEWELLKEPMGMRVVKADDPVFALFRDGEYGDPARGVFRKRWKVPVKNLAGSALLAYADGLPAVYRCSGTPPLVLWAAPLSADCGDWAAQLSFLPFFGELIGHVRARKAGVAIETARPGDRLSWMAPLQYETVRLMDGQGADVPVTAGAAGLEGRRFLSAPTALPGVYQWMADAVPRETDLVNFPEVESDLRAGPPPAGTGDGGGAITHAAEVRAAQEGTPLWPLLLALALGFVAMECVLVALCELDARRLAGEGP